MTKRKIEASCAACGTTFCRSFSHEKFCSRECALWPRIKKADADSCWFWSGAVNSEGYGQISIHKQRHYAHRLAYELANSVTLADEHIIHKCDTPLCCNPAHLLLGSALENMRDMWSKGRGRIPNEKGASHPRAKLNADDVLEIRRRIANGAPKRPLAREYGLSQGAIQGIASGKNWRSL